MRDYELNQLIDAGTEYFAASAKVMKRVDNTLKNISILGTTMLARELSQPEYPERPETPDNFYDVKPTKPFDAADEEGLKEYENDMKEYEKKKTANKVEWDNYKKAMEKYKEDMEKYKLYKKETDLMVKKELIKVLESLNK